MQVEVPTASHATRGHDAGLFCENGAAERAIGDRRTAIGKRAAAAVLREAAYCIGFLAVAIALTWPLAAQLGTIVSDPGDPLLNTWIIDWDCYALTHRGAGLFQANIFYPGKYPLAYSENMIGVALVMLPSYLAGAPPLVTYNLAMLFGFAFSAYGAFVLARKATGSVIAALVAGLLYGFVPFRFDHLAHVQIAWGGWLPLVFAAFLHFRERPTIARAALLCAALVMNGLTNVHWLLFGIFGFALAILLVALARWEPPGEERHFWIRLAAASVVAAAVLYPVLRPYRVVSDLYHMRRGVDEVRDYSAVWTDWLVASDRSAVYGRLPGPKVSHTERHLFPGLVALILAAGAFLVVRREPDAPTLRRWRPPRLLLHTIDALIVVAAGFTYIGIVADHFEWHALGHTLSLTTASNPAMYLMLLTIARFILQLPSGLARVPGETLGDRLRSSRFPLPLLLAFLFIIFGTLGSLGLNAFFHTFLFEHVNAFRGIRAVARWAMLAYVGFALAAAYAVASIMSVQPRRRAQLAGALLLLLALNDVRPRIVWDHAIPAFPAVTEWVKQTSLAGPLIELPIESESAEYYYMYWATAHHKLTMNGTSGFEPPVFLRMHELTNEDVIADEFSDILLRNHCALVILHNDLLGGQTPKYLDWVKRELQRGRLAFVRRFDHAAEGDWVFAVTPVTRDWQRLHVPEAPAQSVQRMLAGEATYNNITFGKLDVCGSEGGGPFRIVGWGLSPYGIREAIARIGCGKVQIPLTRMVRGDVNARWPWYREPAAGFGAIFDHRPKGVKRQTDVQIELVDGRGQRTRLPSVLVDW